MYSYLSESQRKAVDSVVNGDNVFITGAAGTGKSYLLHYIRNTLKDKDIQITATTGIAAVNISGVTLHSWANLGKEDVPIYKIAHKILSPQGIYTRKKILSTDILAIDEISMLSMNTFEMLDELLRVVRGKDVPFGGIQMVLFGDFFQLPPVKSDNFCFESKVWKEANIKTFILKEVFRQQNQRFIELLDNIRHGIICKDDIDLLKSRFLLKCEGIVKPTILSTHNNLVEKINFDKLSFLVSEEIIYRAKFSGKQEKIELLKKNCLAKEFLTLKIGSQVMMLKNTYHKYGIINGSTGIVIGFSNKKQYPIVKFENGQEIIVVPEIWEITNFNHDNGESEILATLTQIPLVLAWAVTVHKSQGMTLDKAECDLKESFADGQVYVALSRIRDISGVYIKSFNVNAIRTNSKIIEFYKKIETD